VKHLRLVNLTPHAISLADAEGAILATIEPSGTVARVDQASGLDMGQRAAGCPVYSAPAYGPVVGLPPEAFAAGEEVLYIVSSMVAVQCQGRRDVVAPGTGPTDNPLRNEAGQIVAVRRLIRAPRED